jgi:hypothetical protein
MPWPAAPALAAASLHSTVTNHLSIGSRQFVPESYVIYIYCFNFLFIYLFVDISYYSYFNKLCLYIQGPYWPARLGQFLG